MARVTVEDCLDHVDNRFELVLLATKRARQLAYGKEAMLEWENDKPTVLALREIADGLVSKNILEESDNTIVEEEVGGVEISAEDMESVPGIEPVAAAPTATEAEAQAAANSATAEGGDSAEEEPGV